MILPLQKKILTGYAISIIKYRQSILHLHSEINRKERGREESKYIQELERVATVAQPIATTTTTTTTTTGYATSHVAIYGEWCVYTIVQREKKEKTSGYIQKIWVPYTSPSYIQQLMLLREKPHIYVVVYDDRKPQENLQRM
jgi:hypothetical protein